MARTRRVVATSLLLAVLAGACTSAEGSRLPEPSRSTGQAPATSTTSARPVPNADTATRTPREKNLSDWDIGAKPLPLRPDGFGRVLPTPPELRERRLPTVDWLPPPHNGRFHSSIQRIGPAIRARMGDTWRPGCPVGLADLRYLRVSFWGFDREPHTGELIVHRSEAHGVVHVFARLFRAKFAIEAMRIATTTDLDARPTGDGNGSGAFVCRPMRQGSAWSAHAYGLAIDINPFQNPYEKDGLVLPELASAYLNRGWYRPGMIRRGGVVVRAFADIGWSWGGSWHTPRDYMHFSATNS